MVFVSIDKASFEWSETQYNQAALGTRNALDYIETSKSSEETKTRDFVKNSDGKIVLTAVSQLLIRKLKLKKPAKPMIQFTSQHVIMRMMQKEALPKATLITNIS